MTEAQQREGARQFFYRWRERGHEDEDARSYWIEILQDILGVENVTQRVDFEKKVIELCLSKSVSNSTLICTSNYTIMVMTKGGI